jgi:hypothetical protein
MKDSPSVICIPWAYFLASAEQYKRNEKGDIFLTCEADGIILSQYLIL